ncbi:MAG TPA: hypothetical protein VJ376_05680 [Pseudomonadota bacterium]|nr:hypothetical protein [Pseudomonadota bacterium]
MVAVVDGGGWVILLERMDHAALTAGVELALAGTPEKANCYGTSVSALVRQLGGLNAAAAALEYRSVRALEHAILAFCKNCRRQAHGDDCDEVHD